MARTERIYTVHLKDDASDRADRVELVREGFSFWALAFNALWLLFNRLWIPFFLYAALMVYLVVGGQEMGLGPASVGILQFGLQLLLAMSAHDIQRWVLKRRGYRMVGVSIGDSELSATQRAYDRWAV